MKLKVFGHNSPNRRSSNYLLCFTAEEVKVAVLKFSHFKHIRIYNVENWTCSRCGYNNATKVEQNKCSYCGFVGRAGHFRINNTGKQISIDDLLGSEYVGGKYSATRVLIDSLKNKK